ncbi:MAG: cob(I)yrinic acid a,c-diamide adenosyltransferase [Planctomycetia bacterium]|nr:cob(I)yrinic acid a,c-diamide adenosyltransferase [Planctomycetia bacterium]
MKVYTRRGDTGETDMFPSGRVPKNHPRMEVLGTLDELGCWLGVVRSQEIEVFFEEYLHKMQQLLFVLGGELACDDPGKMGMKRITATDVTELERYIDFIDEKLPPIRTMLCSSGRPASTFCQLARSVCRRLERRVATFADQGGTVSPEVRAWLNRFSDFLFVLGRFFNTNPEEFV